MPEINVSIGGRLFEVACQDGEEHFLRTAASMLDAEAAVLVEQIGRMPEARMLLMAGLMLADKTAAVEDQIREMTGRVEELEAALAEAQANPVRVEVPVIPEIIFDTFAEIAARAEALASSIEERTTDPHALAEAGFAAGNAGGAAADPGAEDVTQEAGSAAAFAPAEISAEAGAGQADAAFPAPRSSDRARPDPVMSFDADEPVDATGSGTVSRFDDAALQDADQAGGAGAAFGDEVPAAVWAAGDADGASDAADPFGDAPEAVADSERLAEVFDPEDPDREAPFAEVADTDDDDAARDDTGATPWDAKQ